MNSRSEDSARTARQNIYGISFCTIDGSPMPLSQYKGKVLVVVNTASECAFTPQYAGLEALYERYKDRGLVVIGVPSNDFGGQEPGAACDIKAFTSRKFSISFALTDKEAVSGGNAHPFFKTMRDRFGFLAAPHWNFYKYVIGRRGECAAWFSSLTKPDSGRFTRVIEAELAKSG